MQTTYETQRPLLGEQQRAYDDLTTWASEVLPGMMQTSFEFTCYDGELYGHDGLPLTPVFDDALKDAERKARHNPQLAFLVRRTRVERGELDEIKTMASEHGTNTIVVESEYPQELWNATEDIEGYDHVRKQTMLRVIYRRPDGTIVMVSQSLEGSNRQALEAIRESLGYTTDEGELLGQRMHFDLDPVDQEFLVDKLTGIYDRSLNQQFGGNYRAGWRVPAAHAYINTYEFVLAQSDLIDTFIANGEQSPQGLYGFAAAMQQRYERALSGQPLGFERQLFIGGLDPMMEMYQAAIEARANQKVFSGCGASIGPVGELSGVSSLQEAGYSNVTDEDEYGSLSFECPSGHTNYRRRGQLLKACQIPNCHASVTC